MSGLLVTLAGLDDRVSLQLLGCGLPELQLDASRRLDAQVADLAAVCRQGHDLVGVGLAGSLLLSLGAHLPADVDTRLLSLFPWLGLDPPVYGAHRTGTTLGRLWLRAAAWPPLRPLLSRVAVSPPPRGLESVCDAAALTWGHAAGCVRGVECVPLLGSVSAPTTLVLNTASPRLRADRARVQVSALNAALTLALADPADDALAHRVLDWLAGSPFGGPPPDAGARHA